jgi:mannose-6-phosphate isomerase-like protein (cupin superfamily)
MSEVQITFPEFEAEARARGYDEFLTREWPPGAVAATHHHAFSAHALVVRGEMWLRIGDQTQHLRVGDRFEVPRGTPHDERYGEQGAAYWVARRNDAAPVQILRRQERG